LSCKDRTPALVIEEAVTMTATHHRFSSHEVFESGTFAPVVETDDTPVVRSVVARRVLALVRITFGLTFLWAFFDKLLALGFSTGRAQDGTVDRFGDAAWIHGGSPTLGFLKFGADGPFKGFYNDIAGAAWADWLFMAGLLGIGLALTLGIGMRVAGVAGAVLYLLMWTVALPPDTNPVIDDHILGGLTVLALMLTQAGDTWGLGGVWARTRLVRRYPVLR
jgi:thiosulfate dehydrogenase [quinone] large subunit